MFERAAATGYNAAEKVCRIEQTGTMQMPFQIPDEFVGFVQQEVSSGRYSSETDVVLAALSLLKRDREEANLALGEAIDEWQRGEGTPVDEAFAKLRTKLGITK